MSSQPVPPFFSAPETSWRLLHDDHDVGDGSALAAPLEEADLAAWERDSGGAREIDISDSEMLQRNMAELVRHGLDPSALRWAGDRSIEDASALLRRLGRNDAAEMVAAAAVAIEPRYPGTFMAERQSGDGIDQITALIDGTVFCVSPFTGALLASRHALVVDSCGSVFIFFRYDEAGRSFYLVCGGYNYRRVYLYLPSAHVMLKVGNQAGVWGPIDESVRIFRRLMVTYRASVEAYLAGDTKRVLLNGSLLNLGHYFWNEVVGMARFDALGLLHGITAAADYKYGAIDAVAMLGGRMDRVGTFTTPDELFVGALEGSMFPVRLASVGVDRLSADAICRFATRSTAPADRQRIEEARRTDLLLFYNLRAHNKMWIEQVEGAIALSARAADAGRSISLYLDGLPDCAAIAGEIEARLNGTAKVYSGVDTPILTTIAWASACDAYMATVGSGLALLTWVAGKPGVAHAEQHHLGQRNWWPDVRPDAPPPLFVDPTWVTSFGDDSYSNYSIDPERMADLFWGNLREMGIGRANG